MNYMQNPYYSQFQNSLNNPYQPNFLNYQMQNPYAQIQNQQQQQQQQQQITTQPPILQSKGINNEILSVANKEEAIGAPVDLIHGQPSFFYNKSNGEIYLKQFDVPTGAAIFKVFNETTNQEVDKLPKNEDYKKDLKYISEGIDNLHRMLSQIQSERNYPINIDRIEAESIEIENEQPENKNYRNNRKRG